MKSPTFAPTYAFLYPVLAELANKRGYALALHGSLQRDLDVVALPWSDEASSPEDLAEDFLLYAEIYGMKLGDDHPNRKPAIKPHGRLAWTIPLWAGAYIDLSVMPKGARQ